MATEYPTVSRLYVEPRIFCNFCKRNNHTEDECHDKGRWLNNRNYAYQGLPGQSEPPVPGWGPRPTYAYGGQCQVGGYQSPEPQTQRRTRPLECWRCGCLGHIQAHCPNARKQEDFAPMCQYCSREGHYDVDCPQRRNDYGQGQRGVDTSTYAQLQPQLMKQPQGRVPNMGVVIRELDPGASTSTHHVEANQGKEKCKESMVVVVTRSQEYTRGNAVQVNDEDETHRQRDLDEEDEVEVLPPITKKFVPGIPPFPERLKVQEKLPKKKQAEEGMDIVQRLVETEVTLDLATLLRCSPTCRKQFYNEFIKKPRKVKRKEKVDEVVLGTIQSITTQLECPCSHSRDQWICGPRRAIR
ncbi:hypothetical protein KP509_20G073000 [Ceratopteris richardii]|uniref:CCHC-type domain-containing protein n=1 Tax=Ceratopteris richardii TaxID=49495 RepID=A0A8T2SIG4_CERRI|nr:hypothetical protein KP509_20G073000 [Ceratopteris richardii]